MGRNFDFTLNFEGKMTLSKIAKHGGEDGGNHLGRHGVEMECFDQYFQAKIID